MGRVVKKHPFCKLVMFHFNDLLWSQNSCLIKSKRNWTQFLSSKKRKSTQKLQKTPKRQTSSPKKLRKPQKNKQKPHLAHPNRWGCSWWRWSFCSVVFPRPSMLWITAWWTSMASGEAQDWGEAAGLKRWNRPPRLDVPEVSKRLVSVYTKYKYINI